MADTTLKALKNEAEVIGRVKSVDLELGETKDGKENIKGSVTILVEESVNGEVRSHDIRARVYSNRFKQDGNENGLYKGFKTVLDEYKSIEETGNKKEADLVRVDGSLELNEYIGQDGNVRRHNNVSAKFFNRLTEEQVKKAKGPKAKVVVEGIVTGIKDINDDDGLPTDDKKLEFFNVDFYKQLRDNARPIIPIEAIVPSDIAEKFEELYDEGDTGKFTLKINNYAVDAEPEELQEEIDGFGDTEDLAEVKRNFVNNFEVVGGTTPYADGREYDEEQIEEAKQWRQKAISDLEDGYVPSSTPSDNAFGEGSKDDKKKQEEPTTDSDIDDLDF